MLNILAATFRYVNDNEYVSDKFKFVLFADDTNILYPSSNLDFTEITVNNELNKIIDL